MVITSRTGRSWVCVLMTGSVVCSAMIVVYFLLVRSPASDTRDQDVPSWFSKDVHKHTRQPPPPPPPAPVPAIGRPAPATTACAITAGMTEEEDRKLALPIREVTRLFYNRVPKCGSETVIDLFTRLAKLQRFSIYSSNIFRQYHVDPLAQRDLVTQFMNLAQPLIYERHINYINFASFGVNISPVWINVVRDPIQRLASWYYFTRFETDRLHYKGNFTDEERYMTYDECVATEQDECVNHKNYFILIPFFCGHDPICLVPNQKALAMAKRNVEQHYSVVGVVEDLYGFLQVLEYKIPQWFRGVTDLYTELGNELWGSFKTDHKQAVLPATQAMMLERPGIRLEYDFYYYIKQRFYRQLYAVQRAQLHTIPAK